MPVELRPAQTVQRLEVVVQYLHLMRAAVFYRQHSRHVVDDVVKTRAEVEGGPVQEANTSVGSEVDIADVRVSV